MRKHYNAVVLTFTWLLLVSSVNGEDATACKQMDQILSELRELRKLVESRAEPTAQSQPLSARLDLGEAPFLGRRDAPLTIVEFADYQCPFCQRFYRETFPDLQKSYIDTGKVRFFVTNFPLVEKHNKALRAAEATLCAGEQGQFWRMHELLAAGPDFLEMTNLIGDAANLGMDLNAFSLCIESGKFKDAIQQRISDAQGQGIRGTPSFVVGRSTAKGVDGEIVVGAVPFTLFDKKLKGALK